MRLRCFCRSICRGLTLTDFSSKLLTKRYRVPIVEKDRMRPLKYRRTNPERQVKKVNKEQNLESSGLLLSATPISPAFLPTHSNQLDVVQNESDGGGEGSDGSEGTGDY